MRIFALIAATALTAVAQPAAAAPPESTQREGAVMLYFTKSFSGDGRHVGEPMAFGLRLDQISRFQHAPPLPMFDARLALSGRTTLASLGMPLFDSALENHRWFASFASSGGPDGWKYWLIGAIAAAGVACAAEVICDGGSSDDSEDTYTPGGG
jgi:hypothetical protein